MKKVSAASIISYHNHIKASKQTKKAPERLNTFVDIADGDL